MPTVVQFGAGNIGRGFLGQLYCQSGWEIVYIDVVPEVVAGLKRDGGFTIHIVGPGARDFAVTGVNAVDGRDAEAVAAAIDRADLLGVSVGVNALSHIIPALARGLERRAAREVGIDLVICENLLDAAAFLRERLLAAVSPEARVFVAERLGLVESVVSRMIPVVPPERRRAEPLAVWVEAYGILPVAKQGFRNGIPAVEGFDPIDDIHAYEERKLFCHNCMHGMASYFGYAKGYAYVYEAMEDAELRGRVREGGWEAGRALVAKHGFSESAYATHIEDLLTRFGNRALGDTVARCGGDPVRKLGRRDRLVGAALEAFAHGIVPERIAEAIVSALSFSPPGDVSAGRVQAMLQEQGVTGVLTGICGLSPEEPLAKLVCARAAAAGLPVR